jgi:thiopurine S-methyltransferase
MEADFWHRRWEKKEIGFHEEHGNHLLKRYIKSFDIASNDVIFVPLCGKTKDIAWLLSHGFKIVAVELNEDAVQQLFAELGSFPQIEKIGLFKRYYIRDLSVFVGDFFALSQEMLGNVALIYDRAALVALPADMRERYSHHLAKITSHAQQLLICYQYDQNLFKGPPFSVEYEYVKAYYHEIYLIESLYRGYVKDGFRGHSEVFEAVYKLTAIK